MDAIFLQSWAAVSHANYEQCRDEALRAIGEPVRGYFVSEARQHAAARAADFKHSWRARFGTHEPEPWA